MVICLTKCLLSDDKHQLSKIWFAAHWEKKIKKAQIFEVDIERSIQDIMKAELILDLRISGHLLVGIVRIHSRKSKYLLTECSSIFYQIKVFRSQGIDLPDDKQTAPVNKITLDELLDNINIENDVVDAILTNQCRLEDITLKETSERLSVLDDVDMEDFAFHEDDEPFENFDSLIVLNESLDNPEDLSALMKEKEVSVNKHLKNASYLNIADGRKIDALDICNDKDEFDLDSLNLQAAEIEIPESIELPVSVNGDSIHIEPENSCASSIQLNYKSDDKLTLKPFTSTKSIAKNGIKSSKLRKRKLLIDDINHMSYEVMKKHVLDTSGITSALQLAPRSKRLMILKEIGSVEKLLCLPVIKLQNYKLLNLYQRNLKTHPSDSFETHSEEAELYHPRKKSRSSVLIELTVSEKLSENSDAISMPLRSDSTNMDVDNNAPATNDDFMMDTEGGNVVHDPFTEIPVHIPSETAFNNYDIPSNDVQSTYMSKTSEERWQNSFQNRLIELLQSLKLLFEEKSVISFSSLVQNNRKLQVSQKFLCLLTLKKCEVICLEQMGAFKEILISPDLNFDSACHKYFST